MNRLTQFAQTHKDLEKRLFQTMIDRRLDFDVRSRARSAYNRLTDYQAVEMSKETIDWAISKNRFVNDFHNAPLINARKWNWTREDYIMSF